MSRIGDYIIGEEEEGRMMEDHPEPYVPGRDDEDIKLESNVPIPDKFKNRSDLNTKFGNLPFENMEIGQSFVLDGMTEREYTALRARVSRANKKHSPKVFNSSTEPTQGEDFRLRVFRTE